MEAKKRLSKAFYWLDIKLAWLFHFPKPVNWEEFDKKIQEAIEEDHRRYLAALKEVKLAGIKEVVDDFETVLDAPANYRLAMFFDILNTWQAKLKE